MPASPLLRALADAVASAGSRSGGLVDATLVDDIERAGYRDSLEGDPCLTPRRGASPAGPSGRRRGRIQTASGARSGSTKRTATVIRPPGVKIDSGGIAKGLLADLVAERASRAPRLRGRLLRRHPHRRQRRPASAGSCVDDPFGGGPIHELRLRDGAVATSGIGRRCWIDADGGAAHHILDPASGEPAFTGIVQATALAPSALLAEVLAKAALLAGPERADEWLPHGGVVVGDDGAVEVVAAERPLSELAAAA